jgi:hypothetical protein
MRNWADRHAEHPRDLELTVRAGAFFGVSASTARIRLERAGLLRTAESKRIDEQLRENQHWGMLGYLGVSQLRDELASLHEVGELPRLPARMTTAARQAHEAGLIDKDEFSEILQGRTELAATAAED